jgi:hypothetical protein
MAEQNANKQPKGKPKNDQKEKDMGWPAIIPYIPTIVDGAKTLWDKWANRAKSPVVDPQSAINTQIEVIVKRLSDLETSGSEQANLINQIAIQLEGISSGLTEVSRRSSIGLWLGVAATVISFSSLAVILFR